MNVEDPVTTQIYAMLQEKPRRLFELQQGLPLSKYAVVHRMNKLEALHAVVAERNNDAHSTTYRLPRDDED